MVSLAPELATPSKFQVVGTEEIVCDTDVYVYGLFTVALALRNVNNSGWREKQI